MSRIRLPPDRIVRWLAIGVVALAACHMAGMVSRHLLGHTQLGGAIDFFNLDREQSLPTWYSSVLLLMASVLSAIVAIGARQSREPDSIAWTILAVLLLLASQDEIAGVHELVNTFWAKRFPGNDVVFHVGWTFVYAPAALGLGAIYFPFLRRLGPGGRQLLIAGVIYVFGAVGMEIVTGMYWVRGGRSGMVESVLVAVEETLEMTGVIVLIHALLWRLAEQTVTIRIESDSPRFNRSSSSPPE